VSPVVVPQLTTESAYILQPALTTLSLLTCVVGEAGSLNTGWV
jgi:hypothetical protein